METKPRRAKGGGELGPPGQHHRHMDGKVHRDGLETSNIALGVLLEKEEEA